MKTEYETALNEEITNRVEELKGLDYNKDDAKEIVNSTVKLMDKSIELEKLKIESAKVKNEEKRLAIEEEDKIARRNTDFELKQKEIKSNQRSQLISTLTTVGIGLLGIVASVWGVKYTTEFEKDDSYSTTAGKSCARDILRFIKK